MFVQMKFTSVQVLLAAVLATTTGTNFSFAQPLPATVEEGLFLVQKHCAGCHAISAKDVSKHRDAPAFREVLKRYEASDLEEALAEGILTGHSDMPEFKFEPAHAAAIIRYLNALSEER